ncbi:MAG: hypothetical protein IPK06_03070 [Ignavibacteriae bacterium]|nr:hypothetical protein [Ignavibacteriota bacterium]
MDFSLHIFFKRFKTIPIGIAYSIWMGIAVIGTTIAESLVFNSTINITKICFVTLILVGAIGLKLSSNME